jgi:hypothetical protein
MLSSLPQIHPSLEDYLVVLLKKQYHGERNRCNADMFSVSVMQPLHFRLLYPRSYIQALFEKNDREDTEIDTKCHVVLLEYHSIVNIGYALNQSGAQKPLHILYIPVPSVCVACPIFWN